MTPDGAPAARGSHGISLPTAIRLVCHGCGYRVPLDAPRPFRCPNGEIRDNVDHVLRRTFDAEVFRSRENARDVFLDPEPNPFRRYRGLLYSYEVARSAGLADSAYLRILDRLAAAVSQVDGRGFVATPFEHQPELAGALGVAPRNLWVKDETGNVSGSHKARHLMGVLIWLEIARRLEDRQEPAPRLAIASCGNAALAAAVLARAAGRPLDVFVPPEANPRVIERLRELDARLEICSRRPGDPPGDPCFASFLEAWIGGALPFSVQVKRNGLTIEGGCTLGWEMVSTLLARCRRLDHLFIQVGGGALAAACIEALLNARWLGLIDRMPRVHTVQTESAWPLRRAWRALIRELLDEGRHDGEDIDLATENGRALAIRDGISGERLCRVLDHAAWNRGDYMWPWETPPHSIAHGILDDETYDWLAVTEGMLTTGGLALAVSEKTLAEAHRLGREHTTIRAEPTGTSGLAGLMQLVEAGLIGPDETAAVLFTGVER